MGDSYGNLTPQDLQYALKVLSARNNGTPMSRRMLDKACRTFNHGGNKATVRPRGHMEGDTPVGEGPGLEVEIFRSMDGTPDNGEMVSVGFAPVNPNIGTSAVKGSVNQVTGPLVGIVQMSNGGSPWDTVEFDLPIIGGTVVSLPAGNFIAKARDDAGVVPRVGNAPLGEINEFCDVMAWVGYGPKPGSPLWRTIYYANPMPATETSLIGIPRYAKTYQITRTPANTTGVTWQVERTDTTVLDGPYTVGVGVIPPVLRVPGDGALIRLTANTAQIARGAVIFEIGM